MSALTLIRSLSGSEFEPLVALGAEGLLSEFLDREGVPWMRYPDIQPASAGSIWQQLKHARSLVAPLGTFLEKHNIELVHSNDHMQHLTWMAATRHLGLAHIWHLRTAGLSRRMSLFAALFRPHLVTISRFCRNSYPRYISARCRIVRNPVFNLAPDLNKAADRAWLTDHLDIDPNLTIVGWVGNFTAQKRPLEMLEIARRSPDEFFFVLVGEPREPMAGEARRYLEQHKLHHRVHLAGLQLPAHRWISAFDVLLSTAVREGAGRSLLEAMALGTPVIATADGGHLEIVTDGNTGKLVAPSDTEGFCQALLRLTQEPARKAAMVEAARSEIHAQYSIAGHTERMLALYRSAGVGTGSRTARVSP